MQEIANVLGIPDEAAKYVNILKRGKKAYHELLWNGNLSDLVSKSFFSVHSVEEGAMAVGLKIELVQALVRSLCRVLGQDKLPSQCLSVALSFSV